MESNAVFQRSTGVYALAVFWRRMAFPSRFPQRNHVISDDQVKTYYDAHSGRISAGEPARHHVDESPRAKMDRSPRDAAEDEAKALAAKLAAQKMSQARTSRHAKESSEDEKHRVEGRDLGTVRRGQLPPNIEKAVFELKSRKSASPSQGHRILLSRWKISARRRWKRQRRQSARSFQESATIGVLDKVKGGTIRIKLNRQLFCGECAGRIPLAPASRKNAFTRSPMSSRTSNN